MTRRMRHFAVALCGAVAFSVMAVLVKTGRTTFLDDAILTWVGVVRGPIFTHFALAITRVGSGYLLVPIGIIFTALLWRRGDRRDARLYLASTLLGWALYGVLKGLFARPRPTLIPRLSDAGWWSFPSGHSMSSTIVIGLGVILLTKSVWIRILAALVVLCIVSSRVYLGVHYPSDVIAGIMAGSACISAALAFQAVEPELLGPEHQHPPS